MVRRVAVPQAEELIREGRVAIVDVREAHEWATGHLPGARHAALSSLRSDPESFAASIQATEVLFVCERGGRSQQAAEMFESRVSLAYSLDGGTSAWRSAGLPIALPGSTSRVAEERPLEPASPELDAIVGENMKRLRTQRGYTLDTLAGLTGVGRQMLGQIELGRAVPNVGTLWKIATAMEVPFSALLAQPSTIATRVFRQANAKRIVDADGRFSSRALFSPDDKGGVEFYELWLAPHGREAADAHAPGTRENLLVNAGKLVLEVGKERYELARGDAIAFTADVPHAYANPSSEECWMTLVMSYPSAAPR
ncbi:MAG: rhodanese-like domain-containing protein [Polyangiaceae bacterium]